MLSVPIGRGCAHVAKFKIQHIIKPSAHRVQWPRPLIVEYALCYFSPWIEACQPLRAVSPQWKEHFPFVGQQATISIKNENKAKPSCCTHGLLAPGSRNAYSAPAPSCPVFPKTRAHRFPPGSRHDILGRLLSVADLQTPNY